MKTEEEKEAEEEGEEEEEREEEDDEEDKEEQNWKVKASTRTPSLTFLFIAKHVLDLFETWSALNHDQPTRFTPATLLLTLLFSKSQWRFFLTLFDSFGLNLNGLDVGFFLLVWV